MQEADESTTPKRSSRELGMAVAFKLGQAVMLQALGGKQRYWGKIIGTDPYDYFIVRLPLVPGINHLATTGAGLTLRFEADGELYGFSCDVVSATHKPNLLLILSYPTYIEKMQLRRHRRIKCLIPAFMENEFFKSPGFIVDLSRGGCRVVLDMFQKQKIVNLMTGDELNLNISLDSLSSLTCKARVMSLADLGQGRVLGASFGGGEVESQGAIGKFMDRLETIDTLIESNS